MQAIEMQTTLGHDIDKDAVARAYDRWAADTFGHVNDRVLLCGGVGSVVDQHRALTRERTRLINKMNEVKTKGEAVQKPAMKPQLYKHCMEEELHSID